MKKNITILLFILCFPFSIIAQNTFFKVFGGSQIDVAYGGGIAADGGFYIPGYTTSFGNGQ